MKLPGGRTTLASALLISGSLCSEAFSIQGSPFQIRPVTPGSPHTRPYPLDKAKHTHQRQWLSTSSGPSWTRVYSVKEEAEGLATNSNAASGTIVKRRYQSWRWKGYDINYRVEGDPKDPPLLMIHGFGASVGHFRNQFRVLPEKGYRVYSIDMLGYGASDKPQDVEYELELWRDQLLDFMAEMDPKASWCVCGNSIGGLLSLMVTQAAPSKVKGVVLFNSAGGLTSFRDEELPWFVRPLWIFVRVVLFGEIFGPGLFERFRTEENVRSVLSQVYGNKTAVDDELVNILLEPGQDPGAQEVFLKILRAPAGPSPESILPDIRCPIIAIWGQDDPWTPLNTGLHQGSKFSQYNPALKLFVLPETGHCPMDERPDQVHDIMLPFLQQVFAQSQYRTT